MTRLIQIQEETAGRAAAIVAAREDWPCRKGCGDCCRQLAEEPRVSRAEWEGIAAAIAALDGAAAEAVRGRIRDANGRVCPLLDEEAGACLTYAARPVACRAYGFYADRGKVLGCRRIEGMAEAAPEVIWGNHGALEDRLSELGEARGLSAWLQDG